MIAATQPETPGDRLRQIRGAVTQARFARQLGIGRTTLIRYESGSRTPDAQLLLKLWHECKADTLWLLTGIRATDGLGLPSADEDRLLFLFRACAPAYRQHLIATAELLAGAT